MTYLGTRPPTVDEWDKYELHHRARLATKPGLTVMWQISGRSNITDFEEVVKLDKQYISEWTMGLDMLSYRNGEIVTERTNKISLLTEPAAVLGSVSCGMPQLEEEYIEEYVSLPVSLFGEGEFFILRASGDL